MLNPAGKRFQYAVKLDFVTTNNEAEYEAVLVGLTIAMELGDRDIDIRRDS